MSDIKLEDLKMVAWSLKIKEPNYYPFLEAALRILDAIESQDYGCYCDLTPGEEPDGCVLDEGRPQDCIFSDCGDKTKCPYWRRVMPRIVEE